ncbi:MAG: NAD-dependent protein deacylase [Planctomycetes bacterium RIFCSPLOWO2_02_FULL_50_16]|nr:MAG: NAD-dependent protein deacylase [Planctomycetes bacterium RIFCSPLOWO2_02_FULL_50_16]
MTIINAIDDIPFSHLRKAGSCVVLTGAGISAESGIPTFRDAQTGLWSRFNPQELATPEGFRANPGRVWEWYEYRRGIIKKARPNPAHYALARLESLFLENFWLITQNIDGLHAMAGSKNIIELHGNIFRNKCFQCGAPVELTEKSVSDERVSSVTSSGTRKVEGIPPKCLRCGGYVRPDVVWFNESLPEECINKSMELSSRCDIFFVIGTSAAVYPAAHLPMAAKRGGACVLEINTDPTPVTDYADFTLLGKAGEILPEFIKRLEQIKS